MKTATFTYLKKDGSQTPRFILGAKILKDLKNELNILEDEGAKYLTGWEIDETGMTEEEVQNYKETIKDFFYEIGRLDYYLRENNLDPKKVIYKTFTKDSIKDINLF